MPDYLLSLHDAGGGVIGRTTDEAFQELQCFLSGRRGPKDVLNARNNCSTVIVLIWCIQAATSSLMDNWKFHFLLFALLTLKCTATINLPRQRDNPLCGVLEIECPVVVGTRRCWAEARRLLRAWWTLDMQLWEVFNMVVNGKRISWQAERALLWWD